MAEPATEQTRWYALTTEAVAQQLKVDPAKGLSAAEAQQRLQQYGPNELAATREALRENKVNNNLHVAVDGVDALDFLFRRGKYVDALHPDLVLLDLNLPKKNGREVLAEVKADPLLRRIPVVILTTSDAEQDILASYDLHANCYITKPVDLDRFIEVVKSIEGFWLCVVKLPNCG